MEGTLIFVACLVAATLGILRALYAVMRDAKPHHHDKPYRVRVLELPLKRDMRPRSRTPFSGTTGCSLIPQFPHLAF